MKTEKSEAQQLTAQGRAPLRPWQRRLWWLLPLAVLLVLIGVLYALGHLSSADSEMYPTSSLSHSRSLPTC